MTVFSDAVARSRSATARTFAVSWRILPRMKSPDERPAVDPTREPFIVQAHLFAPDKVDGRVSDISSFETGRAPGIVSDDLALTVWDNPTGGVIRQHDIAEEVVDLPAIGRRYRVSGPPGGDATGHIRLDLKTLSPSRNTP